MLYMDYQNNMKYSDFLIKQHISVLLNLLKKSTNIYFFKIKKSLEENAIKILESEIYKFYKKNISIYQNPNRILIRYFVLDKHNNMKNNHKNDNYLKKFYIKHKYLYNDLSIIKLQHIFLKKNNENNNENNKVYLKVSNILKKIDKGEKFGILAQQYSDDYLTKNNSGNLGWIKKGTLNLNFEKQIFRKRLKIGDIKVIVTKKGIHVKKINDKKKKKKKNSVK